MERLHPVTPTKKEDHTLYSKEAVAYHVTMALSTLQRHYQDNIADFAEELHHITKQIDETMSDIGAMLDRIANDEAEIQRLDEEIRYEMRLLERLSNTYTHKLDTIRAIEKEMRALQDTADAKHLLRHRFDEVEELLDEIADIELTLLQKELDKQNLTLKIEPTRQRIAALRTQVKKLEAQKRHLEASRLHRLAPSFASETTPEPHTKAIEASIEEKPHEEEA